MTWQELRKLYVQDHLSKQLKAPIIRLNALNSIEKILRSHMPTIINDPTLLRSIDKKKFKADIAKFKNNGKLNGAEESVVNGLYKFLG